jgi:hypothetical protein
VLEGGDEEKQREITPLANREAIFLVVGGGGLWL